jgi:hypothetical protein
MEFEKSTADGQFTVTIRSVCTDEEDEIPDASMLQLVELLERTAQLFRLAVDPDLQKTCAAPLIP